MQPVTDADFLHSCEDDYPYISVDETTFVVEDEYVNASHIGDILEKQNLNLVDNGFAKGGYALKFEDEFQLICFKMFYNPAY